MAKVKNPLFSERARGKMGGLCYSVARGLDTCKANPSPTQPRTTAQLAVRAIMSSQSRAWAGLSIDNRIAWEAAAAQLPQSDWTGRTYFMSGANLFTKCSTMLLNLGLADVHTPPSVAAPVSPVAFAAANGVLQSVVTWTTPGGTNMRMDIWHLGPISAGRAPKIEQAVHKVYVTAETATTTITGLTPGVHWFWGRIISEDDGQVSPMVLDMATITAT